MEDYVRSGHPEEASKGKNVELVHSLVMCDRKRSLCDRDRQPGISSGPVQSTLTDILGLSNVSAR